MDLKSYPQNVAFALSAFLSLPFSMKGLSSAASRPSLCTLYLY